MDNGAFTRDESQEVTPLGDTSSRPVRYTVSAGPRDSATQVQLPDPTQSATDGIPIKPATAKELCHVRRKAVRQFLYSVLRNGLCWSFLFCLVAMVVSGYQEIFVQWVVNERAWVVILGAAGLVGVPFQVVYAIREFRSKHKSLLASMLQNTAELADFRDVLDQRRQAPPTVLVEMSTRNGAISGRQIRIMDVEDWLDESQSADPDWDRSRYFWILVSKDYRFRNKEVKGAFDKQVNEFRRQNKNLSMQYILDVEHGDYFPDVEAFLVYKSSMRMLYKWSVYKLSICMALDVMYQFMFYCKTNYAGVYYIRKYIEKSSSNEKEIDTSHEPTRV